MKLLAAITLIVIPHEVMAAADEEPFPPEAIAADRYESMAKRSPFVLPTQDAPIVEATWVSDYQIVSMMKSGSEFVILAKKLSTGERIPIRTRENALGIRLVSLQMSSNPREVSAVIALGDAEGTIAYDPELLSSLPSPAAADNTALKSE